MVNRNLKNMERRFDNLMNEIENILKEVTEQFNLGGRDNYSDRSNRGGTEVVKNISSGPFSIFCGYCKGSAHHFYDCPDLLQELRRIDEEARLKRELAREKDVELKNIEIANIREEEVVGAELVEIVQESIVEEAITEGSEKVVEEIEANEEVPEDHSFEEGSSLLDVPHSAPTLSTGVPVPVDNGGKPENTFIDPFVAYCAFVTDSHLYNYVGAPETVICIEHSTHYYSLISLVRYSSSARCFIDLKWYVRFVFDPGISLGFVDGSSCFVLIDAFYDILLIRGRILSNPEGMM